MPSPDPLPNNELYAVLGVSRQATAAEIAAAFRRRVMSIHPDHGGGVDDLRQLTLARDVLTDPRRRARYDASGATADRLDDDKAMADTVQMLCSQMVEELVIDGDLDLAHADVVQKMRTETRGRAQNMARQVHILQAKRNRALEAVQRLIPRKRRGRPDPVMSARSQMITQALHRHAAILQQKIEKQQRVYEAMMELASLIDEYGYVVDPISTPADQFYGAGVGIARTMGWTS